MIDFKDVTFIVPVRFDSQDRRDNFKTSIGFLLRNFDTNIIVLESDENSNEEFVKSVSDKIKYVFEKSDERLFHRTRLLNDMTKMCETNIVVNYDVDVLFTVAQYLESRDKILNGCDMVFPYSGKFYDVQKNQFHLVDSDSIENIDLNQCTLFNPNSVGGAFFFNKERYTQIGLENENFVSWGHEDWERVVRIEIMGYSLCRVEGPLYHLTHSRTHNSSDSNPLFHSNGQEFHKIRNMNREQLTNHIKTWRWV
jgi:predicted glycosyltransferase involved in capsule biosynthesis